ncbi:MAG: TIM barrel protein [Candidatus Poribacteria bacterium]|nr:TIM barrel protein [Candidatus Poribacteria bacterium]MDE0506489.1 TIM barrel protein [Candidatus Poribacteria bacterium]
MMKLGTMSLNLRNVTATEFARIVYELGFDVIELHTSAFESTDVGYLRELKTGLMKKGLPLGYIGISNDFGRPVDEHPEQIALIKKWIDVADFMSCPLVRVFGAYIPEGCEDEETLWSPMIAGFQEVADYGYEKGIFVGLQNHNHNNVTRTGDDLLRALRETDRPFFSHVLDTGQYAGSPGASGHRGSSHPDYDCYESIAKTAPYAVYVRTKFYRIDSGVEEWLDYPRIIDIFVEVGYNGTLSVVYEGESDAINSMEKAAKHLRTIINGF